MMMKACVTVGMVLAASTVVLAAPRALQDHDHDHDHGDETCACQAETVGFSTDCSASALIAASVTTLQGCAVTEEACHAVVNGVEECQNAFFHLYYVHGACDHDTLTAEQEELVHTYEDVCASCGVKRPYDPDVDDCVVPSEAECTATTNNAGTAAAQALDAAVAAGTVACSDEATRASWKTLLAYHDLCDGDALPTAVELAVHTHEEACEDYFCNTADQTYNPAECIEEEDHDHDHDDEPIDCDEHDHDHRRRLGGDHDHEEDPCAHTSVWVWVFVVVVILAIGGAIFMKVQGLGCFADDDKSSSG